MELFQEFFKLAASLNKHGAKYSLVGGVALAFHGIARMTKDIDILGVPTELETLILALEECGYQKLTDPWKFKDTNLTLHRYGKASSIENELILVDLLIGEEPRHQAIISNSITDESYIGTIQVARQEDLIWMKSFRMSKQDEADIENLHKAKDPDRESRNASE